MKLSEETKKLITKEYNEFKAYMYVSSPKETRDELGQFFTPAEISIQMIERYNVDSLTGLTILDPTSGSGNLLAACLIAGADPDKVFGNDYDIRMVKACRERLNAVCDLLGKPHIKAWQIHRGDATDAFCLNEFGPSYKEKLTRHYLDLLPVALFDLELTPEQKEFLKGVD